MSLKNLSIILLFTQLIAFAGNPKDSLKLNSTTNVNTKKGINIDSIPIVDELIYEYRIALINKKSDIKIDYNSIVKNYIELYTVRQRKLLSKIITRSEQYFPIFEQYLAKYDLPMELKYLAIIESALNPIARSRSGATGLWQFMYDTGTMLNLKVTTLIDERNDVYKSTEAACKYLEYLYRTFGDWQLALAAYNGGPGTVKNAIKLSGGKNTFWEIRNYLPKETQGYVPAYIGAFYAYEYNKEHNIFYSKNEFNFTNIGTLLVKGNISLQTLANNLKLDYNTVKLLNPVYKKGFIPNDNRQYTLVLPSNKISEFVEKNPNLISTKKIAQDVDVFNGQEKILYTVEKGDFFHKIALKHRCTIEDISNWNNMSSKQIRSGQQLIIYNLHIKEPSNL